MDGSCLDADLGDCLIFGGAFQGFDTVCAVEYCGIGACCFDDGSCQDLLTTDCQALGGIALRAPENDERER